MEIEAAGAKFERLCDELSVCVIGTSYANMGCVDLCVVVIKERFSGDVQACVEDTDSGVICRRVNTVYSNCSHGSYPVIFSHRFGSIFGRELIFVSGPSFELSDITKCLFGILVTDGVYLTETQCLCVVPPAHDTGLTI
uniref:Uncharacterized protein n=1 Tax=Amphimedon queenslandica TaxID=400682 RepID=A0A1X7UEZ6_AMPQE